MMSSFGQVHTLTLPSGAKVRVRRPSVLALVAAGGFPAELTIEVWKLLNKKVEPEEAIADPEALKRWALLIEKFVPHVLVDPKIAEETEVTTDSDGGVHGTVRSEDISDFDKQYLFLYGNGVYRANEEEITLVNEEVTKADLGPFRDRAAGVDVGSGGDTIQPEAVDSDRVAVDTPVGAGL